MSNFSIADFGAILDRLWARSNAQPDEEMRYPREVAEWRANVDRAIADGTYSGYPLDYDPRLIRYRQLLNVPDER